MRFIRQLRVAAKSVSGRNLLSLATLQAATFLIPLATVPWLLRVLQPESFGAYSLSLAFGSYAAIVVDFGFLLTGTQRVAQIRDNQGDLTAYFWTVQCARALLAIAAILISVCVVIAVPSFRVICPVMLASLLLPLGTVLFPQWLFMGLEQMRTLSILTIAARGVSACSIFIFVKSPDDVLFATLITAGSGVMGGLISALLIARLRLVGGLVLPAIAEIRKAYSESLPIFFSGAAFSLYSASNSVILGIVRDTYEVGVFNAADKVRSAAMLPINVFAGVFYPRVSRLAVESRTEAIRMIVKITILLGVLMGCISSLLLCAAPAIVQLVMGDNFDESVSVLKTLSFVPFFVGVTGALGTIGMLNLGLKKQYSWIVVTGGLVNVPLLIFLGKSMGAQGAAISLLATEVLVTILMLFVLLRRGFFFEVGTIFARKRLGTDR